MSVFSQVILRGLLMAAAVTASLQPAQPAEVKVIVANALKDAYAELTSAFEKSTGHKVTTTWAGTENATKRVSVRLHTRRDRAALMSGNYSRSLVLPSRSRLR
jgi:ABC-type molybdate transport system substrate-binding protein